MCLEIFSYFFSPANLSSEINSFKEFLFSLFDFISCDISLKFTNNLFSNTVPRN